MAEILKRVTLNGVTYEVSIEHDSYSSYFDHEGGITEGMLEWPRHTREKKAGQIRQHSGQDPYLLDFAALVKKAREESWRVDAGKQTVFDLRRVCQIPQGADPGPFRDKLTAKQHATLAAWEQVRRLREYYRQYWWYVGITVKALNGPQKGTEHALWRVESDSGDYINEVADELVGELDAELQHFLVAQAEREAANAAMLNSSTL